MAGVASLGHGWGGVSGPWLGRRHWAMVRAASLGHGWGRVGGGRQGLYSPPLLHQRADLEERVRGESVRNERTREEITVSARQGSGGEKARPQLGTKAEVVEAKVTAEGVGHGQGGEGGEGDRLGRQGTCACRPVSRGDGGGLGNAGWCWCWCWVGYVVAARRSSLKSRCG